MKLETATASNSFEYVYLSKRIFKYIKPLLFRVIIGFLVAIPVGLLDGVVAFVLKPYIDLITKPSLTSVEQLMIACLPFAVVFFAAMQGCFRYLNEYLTDWTSQKITNSVKIDLFKKLTNLDTKFYDDNSSGIVLSRFLSDPDTASRSVITELKALIASGFGAISLIFVMLYNSWKLAIVGVFVLVIAFIPMAILRKRVRSTSNKMMVIGGGITTDFNESYIGNKIISSYNLQKMQQEKFIQKINNSFSVNMSLVKRVAWMSPLMYLIASCGIAIVIWYGTYLIRTGAMTAGGFASFVTSLLLLYKPVRTMGNTLTSLQNVFVSIARVFELFDLESSLKEPKEPKDFKFENNISFENLCFEYEQDVPVLKNVNLAVKKNETLAIVGNSGGGKTTLVNLIPRFYDVTQGAIKIDGVDIRDMSINSLRKNVSVVFQDNFLFTGSIRENIMMGNFDASEEELNQVIEAAHLSDFVKDLPEGIDTILGERGTTLSGGQRQRVAIARAMIKKSPIVVLDEATSALDNKSEKTVQKALDNLMKNKTVFVIAHRLSTIQNVDRIAVIENGELKELGSHNELMQYENGIYKNLYETQFHKDELAI